ncbi:VWFA-related protein [Silvibacterium bohemicum]|uniref:VWFA-related protein n=1 Tax=Silvibacterium bohemicum TaxID=1577686 RepID=A0A841K9A5_9BACT|nr:VWA domain-containing protein [Silvibacterium bohemicum]MBB6147128.1 VWFA-related protein [Silvibacterium bohemicum]
MTQGALAIAFSLFMMGAAQQQPQQQQTPPNIPDAPAPSGLSDLKGQVTPGSGTIVDKQSSPDLPPGQTTQAPAPTTPPAPDTFQTEAPETPKTAADAQAFTIHVPVNYIDIPVTVRDKHHQLVAGLTWRQFRIFEDGQRQKIAFFTVDPYPLSVAFVIDQTLPSDIMQKVNESLAAVTGAFSPADTVAVITYNNNPQTITDFTGAQGARLPVALQQAKRPGRDMGVPQPTGPLASGMSINGNSPDPNLAPQRGNPGNFLTIPRESHPLNDAILYAAQMLSRQPKGRRRILYVITDGKEKRSTASQKEVLRFLLTNNITVYGTLVGDAATWGVGYLDKVKLPLLPADNVMPKYTTFTGGYLESQFSENGMQKSFAAITGSVRTQYTLGYYSHAPSLSEKHHSVDVRVEGISGLDVTAKEGYYPSLANMTQ